MDFSRFYRQDQSWSNLVMIGTMWHKDPAKDFFLTGRTWDNVECEGAMSKYFSQNGYYLPSMKFKSALPCISRKAKIYIRINGQETIVGWVIGNPNGEFEVPRSCVKLGQGNYKKFNVGLELWYDSDLIERIESKMYIIYRRGVPEATLVSSSAVTIPSPLDNGFSNINESSQPMGGLRAEPDADQFSFEDANGNDQNEKVQIGRSYWED